MSEVFIGIDDAHDLIWSSTPPVVLDVRWALGVSDGRRRYMLGHLPGAVYVDLDRQLAGTASPEAGRHPLPDLADLQETARSWGMSSESQVLVYDDAGGTSAARAWWLLRWAGVARSSGRWRTTSWVRFLRTISARAASPLKRQSVQTSRRRRAA